ncbi:Demethylmenaquinone methyltransferase [Pseudovibrio axinellae]|uniref:Demethylmenaquinone methyltransferase n=1 Tax=Pseudovibrio axinellae TaxID=989403 RepID=A0A165YGT8_9HYPH|nr:class I SAM-dependent methyltransferase [Pseudovibrio axinellae]KZL18831.1 Demethylmenaquinone methyltransferase [Pseudovibrio axinellae]SEP91196.1 S-adenosylmethionine-diacylgycerolhomoserine-N-methlytransferase [Pseudovibrio axinellae]
MTIDKSSASLMDKTYKNQRHFYDLTRKHYLFGRDHLIRNLSAPRGGTVLELGCGTGRNLIEAAKAYPSCKFFGVDISSQMLRTAEANIHKADLSHRIHLAQGDATRVDPFEKFGIETFDRVFFSYCVSMISPWEDALKNATKLLAKGGQLSLVDFGQQERLPGFFKLLLEKWLSRFHVTPRPNLQQVMSDLAQANSAKLRFLPLYRGYACYAELDSSFYTRFMEKPAHHDLLETQNESHREIRKAG